MNQNITSFYVVNSKNITVAYESNLADLITMFQKIEPNARNYQYYYRQFKKESTFTEGQYTFQQLV